MISAYSKVADAAADLVRYLSSAEVQKKRAIHFSVLPTRPAFYSDPDVLAKNPFFKIMVNVFDNPVARPSTVTGADYNQLSNALPRQGESPTELSATFSASLIASRASEVRSARYNASAFSFRKYGRPSATPPTRRSRILFSIHGTPAQTP